jgi:Holliday junction resolvase RusA-like endonuclease
MAQLREVIRGHMQAYPPCITMTLLGKPIPKARPRGKVHGMEKQHFYTDKSTVFWELLARMTATELISKKSGFPLDCAFAAEATFVFTNTKKQKRFHTARPDLTNVVKSIEDGIQEVLISEDSKIVYYDMIKMYGDKPGATIRIWELPDKLLEEK